jgi:hypothetical protein
MGDKDKGMMPINEKLVWDYDIPPDAQTNEAFREWYVKRVLTHGTAADIRTIGLKTIHHYFPRLYLPSDIREFWLWYFEQPVVKERYGSIDAVSERTA